MKIETKELAELSGKDLHAAYEELWKEGSRRSAAEFGTKLGVTREDEIIYRDGSVASWARSHGYVPEAEKGLRLTTGRAIALSIWGSEQYKANTGASDDEVRALSGLIGSGGGFVVPTSESLQIIDTVRNLSVAFQAGVGVVPWTDSDKHTIARIDTDMVFSWRTQNAQIAESDAAFGKLELSANTLAGFTKVPVELIEDALPSFEATLRLAISRSMAVEIDRVIFFGDGDAAEPVGLFQASGIATDSLAAVSSYDELLDMVSTVEGANFEPGRFVMAPDGNGEVIFSKLRSGGSVAGDGPYLEPPAKLDGHWPPLTSNQITDANAAIGQWDQLVYGSRMGISIVADPSLYRENGQVGIFAMARGDVGFLRKGAFVIATDLS